MSGDASETAVAHVWVRRVETQFRIRLPVEIVQQIPWLRASEGFSVDCVGRIGSHGQLRLIVADEDKKAFSQLESCLRTMPLRAGDISKPWMDLVRYFATGWKIICTFEAKGKRFTFVLPKEVRDLGIIPNENDVVVLFGTGEILEIWLGSHWLKHISNISPQLKEQTAVLLDERQ